MSFLLVVFLTLVCLFNDYPAVLWGGTPELSAALTAGAVLLIGLHAFIVSRRVSWPLARDPGLRDRVLARYERWRFFHQTGQFVLYGLTLGVFGWGWAVRVAHPGFVPGLAWEDQRLLGVELLTLMPFLAGQALTWIFFYDADRAAHRATHRLLEPDPFAQGSFSSLQNPASLSTWLEPRQPPIPPFGGRWTYVAFQFRQKMALVFIPVVLLITWKELFRLFPGSWQHWQTTINLAGIFGLLAVFIAMPWLIRLVLGLQPLPPGALRDRLLATSRRLGFRCTDILLWNTRSGMGNAMVIGLVPWLRYVVFTDRLIEEFPEEEVEAVFGHEVGHIRHHHMFYYLAFLTLSMIVMGLAAEHYLLPFLNGMTQEAVSLLKVGSVPPPVQSGEAAKNPLGELAMFPVVGAVVAYIFVVFGFLSRRCERQADVFGCRAGSCGDPNCLGHGPEALFAPGGAALCSTGIRTFIRALEKVAHINGISRDRPGFLQSWQHATIAQRVAFLQSVLVDPRIEARFQQRLRLVKWGLLVALAALLVGLVLLRGWPW
jgi:Zn-dependent protease with chaperone function